jgi:RNA polymerase sigma-70 factor (ECF subfamily)
MDDADLVSRLRAGDEEAFAILVGQYHTSLLRLAETMVPSRAVAEEVVQDTWLGVVRGIGRFEGRSSLRTWIFHILVNRARSTGAREQRSAPRRVERAPTVDLDRFASDGRWVAPPRPWTDDVEDRLTADRLAGRIRSCIAQLPPQQRQVVTLRDLEEVSATDVCRLLGISDTNQRVLLHRGRARIRGMIDIEMGRA